MPKRFQIKRRKGWKKPENGVVVSRPSKWGNPFKISKSVSREQAIGMFEKYLKEMPKEERKEFLEPLRAKDLGCYCALGVPCHADVLMKWANRRS